MMMNQAVVSNPTVGSPMLAQILKDGKIKGSTHLGGSLERMVESYSSLQAVCGELIQNSIDLEFGGATSISIVVNFDQNKVAYLDNGKGLSVETIAHALNTIGKTVKASDKYGKFGIGMASPIAICEKFSMLTAQSGSPYIRVEFDRKSLYYTHIGGFNFPTKEEKTIFHQDGKTPRQNKWSNLSWWRTGIEMEGLTIDKIKRKFDFEEFRDEIQFRYGPKLASLGTTIKITIIEMGLPKDYSLRAKLYSGKALPVWEQHVGSVGKVTVTFYLAPAGYKGKLNIGFGGGDNPSRVPLNKLFLSPILSAINEKTREALKSGMFQGEAVGEHLRMKVNRNSFENDDAMMGFVVALDDWYRDVGSKYYEDAKSRRAANRYQQIGLEVIGRYGDLLSKKEGSPFADVFANAQFGSTGKGHSKAPTSTIVPGHEMQAKAIAGAKEGKEGGGGHGATNKTSPKPEHHPAVSIGPNGGVRQVVRGHSTGFHILVDDIGHRLWHFDPASLCLKINPTHPLFGLAEKSDAKLREFYGNIMITSLRIASLPEEVQTSAQVFAESHMDDWVRQILMK